MSRIKDIRNRRINKAKKYTKIRIRMRALFFVTVFTFSLVALGIIKLLEQLGLSINHVKNHSFIIFMICVLCIILSTMASSFMIIKVFNPLNQISKAIKIIASGDYNVKLEYDGKIEEFADTFENFNNMAKELNSVEMIRNDFIANVSHEFKTPLSSVTGYVTLLQDPELTEEERMEYIQKVFFNIEKLNDLTDNILRISKIENQTYLDPPVSFRLDEQIREAIVILEPKWSKKNIELDIDLPEAEYFGQKSLLFQVWVNLIGNAIKFSDDGGSVSISLKKSDSFVSVFISDDGIGMTQETMEHIFEKFYQGDTSRQSQGNGLGLALCKEILNRCGGKIFVTSKPGKGSVFVVQLT
ncbi:HAMP domain-containing sensor histidine kinase [Porcipelethomonas sp.]|uniref:HAMP domain-containing sensor histidine kinase n=1 Tax=Porcipelethomonas sp. TaxID=2981675 RepID=UPI003EF23419